MADKTTLDLYEKHGKKLVAGDDIESRSAASWVHDKIRYNDNIDNT